MLVTGMSIRTHSTAGIAQAPGHQLHATFIRKKHKCYQCNSMKQTWTNGGGGECWVLSLENVFHVPHNYFAGENMFVEYLLEVISVLHLKAFGSLSPGRWGILVLGLGS